MYTRHKHASAWRNTQTSHTLAPTAPRVTIQKKTQHPWHHLITQTYLNTPRVKISTIFNNDCYTTNIPTYTHTITTTDIKTNMRHIHTSIVSRHLSTRGNNKIVRTPPPHISSSEILPRLARRTLAQLRTNEPIVFTQSRRHISPFFNTHIHNTDHLLNCTHIRTTFSPLDLWTPPTGMTALLAIWTEKLAVGPQAGTSDIPH